MTLTKLIAGIVSLSSGTLYQRSVLAIPTSKIQNAPAEIEININTLIPKKSNLGTPPDLQPDDLKLANLGECHLHPDHTLENCNPEDLGMIGYFLEYDDEGDTCTNLHEPNSDVPSTCEDLAELKECLFNPIWMMEYCALSCVLCVPDGVKTFKIGVKQEIPEEYQNDQEHIKKTRLVIASTSNYMSTEVMEESDYDYIRRYCHNKYAHCASLAAAGLCEDDDENDVYYDMITDCAPACQTCDTYEVIETCTPDEEENIFEEGDMDLMFRRMVGEQPPLDGIILSDYVPFVHSRPDQPPANMTDDSNFILGPWVVTLDNFLSNEECDHLIKLGQFRGYDRSELENEEEEDEDEEQYRTSENTWCKDECNEDPVVTNILERISNITGIPEDNSEYLQLLKYTEGQFYKTHHDFIEDSNEDPDGPRLITVFLYLNDVEEGGATRFNDLSSNNIGLSLDIQARKGMALIWPSVEDDPTILDERTYHEALPVIKGVKYGANAWLHLRNVKDNHCDYDAFSEVSWHPSFE